MNQSVNVALSPLKTLKGFQNDGPGLISRLVAKRSHRGHSGMKLNPARVECWVMGGPTCVYHCVGKW